MPIKLLLIILALLLPVTGFADDATDDNEWYQVELIVFAHSDSDGDEKWPSDPGVPDMLDTVALHNPADRQSDAATGNKIIDPLTGMQVQDSRGKPAGDVTTVNLLPDAAAATTDSRLNSGETPYLLLDAEALQLNDDYEKLNDAADYTPLLHIAWRQPVPARDSGQSVKIDSRLVQDNTDAAGQDTQPPVTTENSNPEQLARPPLDPSLDPSLADESQNSPLDNGSPDMVPADETSTQRSPIPPSPRLEGTINISRGRYLHVWLDLLYRPEKKPAQSSGFFSFLAEDKTPDAYRLTQQRRVRSGELHYFDHPRFGVLALITPYEPPVAEGNAQTIPLGTGPR